MANVRRKVRQMSGGDAGVRRGGQTIASHMSNSSIYKK